MQKSNKNKEICLVMNTFFLYNSNDYSFNFIYRDIISFVDFLVDIRCIISFNLSSITFLPLFPSTVNNTNFLLKFFWSYLRNILHLQCVFHGIRFKVN